MARFFYIFLFLSLIFSANSAHAHPMDLGHLQINVLDSRIKFNLRLHLLAAQKFMGLEKSLDEKSALDAYAVNLFAHTIGISTPILGASNCIWRRPELAHSANYPEFLELNVIAVCLQVKMDPFSLEVPLPFLQNASPIFQLITQVDGAARDSFTILATPKNSTIKVGADDIKSFGGFLRMGMAHIGALPSEWQKSNGELKFPEGLDHIFFVLALVLSGGTLLGLLKCISGFTLGHSITLGLSTMKVIHVHSRWVEALIALSIAYVAGSALFKSRSPHRWMVATLFGTVHGLGFASALQELDLSKHELWKALLGFNLGVEFGQCVIILLTIPVFLLVKYFSDTAYTWLHRIAAAGLLLIGSYWFVLRAVN